MVYIKCRMQMYIDILHSDFGFTYIAATPGILYFGSLSSRKILSWYHLPLATDTRRKYFVYPFHAYGVCICTRKQSIWVKSRIIHKSNLRFTIAFHLFYFIFFNWFYSDLVFEDCHFDRFFRKRLLIYQFLLRFIVINFIWSLIIKTCELFWCNKNYLIFMNAVGNNYHRSNDEVCQARGSPRWIFAFRVHFSLQWASIDILTITQMQL